MPAHRTAFHIGAIAALVIPATAHADDLFGIRFSNANMLRIDTSTGASAFLVDVDALFPQALAYNSDAGTIHTIDAALDAIVTIDPTTGSMTDFAVIPNSDAIHGLTYDPFFKSFFGVDFNTEAYQRTDGNTGDAVQIATLPFDAPSSLAYDPISGLHFGTDTFEDILFTVDPATGTTATIGPLGFNDVQGLAIHPDTGAIFGVDGASQQLLSIDRATGAATPIGSTGVGFLHGLAFVPAPGALALIPLCAPMIARRRRAIGA